MSREIEVQAIAAIIAYETERGRIARRVKQGKGYNVLSQRKDEERHIEVKGRSSNKLPSFIRIFHTEGRLLLNDKCFWIYLEHSVGGGDPVVIPISRLELLERRITLMAAVSIAFTKRDWEEITRKKI